MNATNAEVKAALIALLNVPVKVRAGTGSHKQGILVYLPRSVRTDAATLAKAEQTIQAMTGRIELSVAFKTPGTLRNYYSILPIYESSN
jgi:hypothetical protein